MTVIVDSFTLWLSVHFIYQLKIATLHHILTFMNEEEFPYNSGISVPRCFAVLRLQNSNTHVKLVFCPAKGMEKCISIDTNCKILCNFFYSDLTFLFARIFPK